MTCVSKWATGMNWPRCWYYPWGTSCLEDLQPYQGPGVHAWGLEGRTQGGPRQGNGHLLATVGTPLWVQEHGLRLVVAVVVVLVVAAVSAVVAEVVLGLRPK